MTVYYWEKSSGTFINGYQQIETMETGCRKLLKNPRETANIISALFFGWSIPIFKKTYKQFLQADEVIIEPLEQDRSQHLGDRLEKYVIMSFHLIFKIIIIFI